MSHISKKRAMMLCLIVAWIAYVGDVIGAVPPEEVTPIIAMMIATMIWIDHA